MFNHLGPGFTAPASAPIADRNHSIRHREILPRAKLQRKQASASPKVVECSVSTTFIRHLSRIFREGSAGSHLQDNGRPRIRHNMVLTPPGRTAVRPASPTAPAYCQPENTGPECIYRMDKGILEQVSVIEGDITRQRVEAIVNAANSSLLGGGGVDGAIHRAAGPGLLEECRRLGGCGTGQARITGGYNLPARWVIHTVGPVWRGGQDREDELLASCYASCLAIVKERAIGSVAFPSISTGAYGFPMERAAEIAARHARIFLEQNNSPVRIAFVCFGKPAFEIHSRAVRKIFA
jgi:O-acetyl-ADP-ribose deacetylase